MKRTLAVVLFTVGAAVAAPLPTFEPVTIELPPVSLLDRAKRYVPTPSLASDAIGAWRDAALWFRALAAGKTKPRLVSMMPVVQPRSDIDPRMVHGPRPGIDYKMPVKAPGVEARGGRSALR